VVLPFTRGREGREGPPLQGIFMRFRGPRALRGRPESKGMEEMDPCALLLLRDQHGRRRLLHFNATEHPTGEWIGQQVREAFPEDSAPRYLILDRDSKCEGEANGNAQSSGHQPDSNRLSEA
jgi:hypothetical protein